MSPKRADQREGIDREEAEEGGAATPVASSLTALPPYPLRSSPKNPPLRAFFGVRGVTPWLPPS